MPPGRRMAGNGGPAVPGIGPSSLFSSSSSATVTTLLLGFLLVLFLLTAWVVIVVEPGIDEEEGSQRNECRGNCGGGLIKCNSILIILLLFRGYKCKQVYSLGLQHQQQPPPLPLGGHPDDEKDDGDNNGNVLCCVCSEWEQELDGLPFCSQLFLLAPTSLWVGCWEAAAAGVVKWRDCWSFLFSRSLLYVNAIQFMDV